MTNPLLEWPNLVHGVPPLDEIKPEHFLPALDHAIRLQKAEIEAIKNNPAAPTFENTIEALEFSGVALGRVGSIFNCFLMAHGCKALDKIKDEFGKRSAAYSDDVNLDRALFARVKAVYDAGFDGLDRAEQKTLLKDTYKGFTDSGIMLDEAGQERLRAINIRIEELSKKFGTNCTDAENAYKKFVDEAELPGVPDRIKEGYAEAAAEEGVPGKYLITILTCDGVLDHCTDRALREEVYNAYTTVGSTPEFDNRPVALEIFRLRHERAQMLGYPNHAAYILSDRMVDAPEKVMAFLEASMEASRAPAKAYMQKIEELAHADGVTDFKPWDHQYYAAALEKKELDFDAEAIKAYFPLDKVLAGARAHFEKLFDIKMREVKNEYPVYHPDVRTFEVYDGKTQDMIGIMYGDYYTRSGASSVKQDGAWMDVYRARGMEEGEDRFPIVTTVCNFDKPTASTPSLLSLEDVQTIFHEQGHGTHGLLGKGRYSSQTGIGVAWDFIELPSQLQEEWVKKKEVLDTFAAHYRTGEKIPADLIDKALQAQNLAADDARLRLSWMALLDMHWHMADPATYGSVEAFEDSVIKKYDFMPRSGGSRTARFLHIIQDGYDAGYNSYRLADNWVANVWQKFEQNGLYDPATSQRLREKIYEPGGSVDPMELLTSMLGHAPDAGALFAKEGAARAVSKEKGIQPPKMG